VRILDLRTRKKDFDGEEHLRTSRWDVCREMLLERYESRLNALDEMYPEYPIVKDGEVTSGVYVGGELVEHHAVNEMRSPLYDVALRSLNQKYMIGSVESLFHSYMDFVKKYRGSIFLMNRDDGSIVKKPLETRYDGKYARGIIKRSRYLYMRFRGKPSVLLTLTVDPKKYDYDITAMWGSLSGKGSEFNRFMKYVREKLRSDGKPCMYVMTIESMKGREQNDFIGRGVPHIHVAFFGVRRIDDIAELSKHWGNGYVWINKTREGETVRSPLNYIIKYVTKTYCEFSDELKGDFISQALTWFFSCRLWNTSRGLVYPLKSSSGEYIAYFLVYYTVGVPLDVLGSVENQVMSDMAYDYRYGLVS
jgi:hypothetical protein